ncbi:MAG: beta-hydroxyacyl-ACP dehydratase [Pirellulaceae bacterium]
MRWFWIDRFTEFVSGKHAKAVKAVSLAEEAVDEYAPGATYLPASLLIEGTAQCGGLLVAQLSDFRNRTVLAKVGNVTFHQQAYPGSVVAFDVQITSVQPNGAFVSAQLTCNDKPLAELDLMFAFLTDDRFDDVTLFEPAALLRMCRLMRMFEVGKYEDGTPLKIPQYMLDAEKAELSV